MNKTPFLICLFLLLLFSTGINAQQPDTYAQQVAEAMKLYENKEYLQSAQKFSEAFAAKGIGGINDRYNAACSWALAGKPDSAFVQLFKIAESGKYTSLVHMTTDTDLDILHNDKRWPEVVAMVKANKDKKEEGLDKPLVAILDSIYLEDQRYRLQISAIENQYGRESAEMEAHWRLINEKDSLNVIKVKRILDSRGWLGEDVVGQRGNLTLFLVIQHADSATQAQYLPMMREAVAKGNADASSLALLEDRLALTQGKRQLYGSQVTFNSKTGKYYVSPLDDPDHVDERRAKMGLGKLQYYIDNWGMTWDVEQYKKELPELEDWYWKL